MGIFNRTEALMTPQSLRERFLLGVDLTLDDGTPYPDTFFEYNINAAISMIEHELDIYLAPVDQVVNYDFNHMNYISWDYVQLDHYPIQRVDKWEVVFPSDNVLFEYPNSWIKIEADRGMLQLFPDQGSIPSWMTNRSFMPYLITSHSSLPHLYKISYTAGFAEDKIPFIFNEAIGLTAAMLPLDIAGDLIAGAGIASSSLSIDGLSQSIGTTSSATNSGYGARAGNFQKRLKATMQTLQNFYKGIKFDAI